MKFELIFTAALLGALPGLVLLQSSSGIASVFGIFMIGLALVMIFASFTKMSISKIPWITFALSIVVLIFSTGYLARAISISFGIAQGILDELSASVILIELSIIAGRLFATHKKYEIEFEKAGYDMEESLLELGKFSKLLLSISFGIAALSVGVLFFFELLPEVQIDAFTALIVATVIYFLVARVTLRSRKQPFSGESPSKA